MCKLLYLVTVMHIYLRSYEVVYMLINTAVCTYWYPLHMNIVLHICNQCIFLPTIQCSLSLILIICILFYPLANFAEGYSVLSLPVSVCFFFIFAQNVYLGLLGNGLIDLDLQGHLEH